MVKELSEAEFGATFGSSMTPMSAPANVGEALHQVEQILDARGGQAPPRVPELSKAYLSGDSRHGHLLFWYGVPNVYVVIVLAMPSSSIIGHHRLDLNAKYGLPVSADPTWWPPSVN